MWSKRWRPHSPHALRSQGDVLLRRGISRQREVAAAAERARHRFDSLPEQFNRLLIAVFKQSRSPKICKSPFGVGKETTSAILFDRLAQYRHCLFDPVEREKRLALDDLEYRFETEPGNTAVSHGKLGRHQRSLGVTFGQEQPSLQVVPNVVFNPLLNIRRDVVKQRSCSFEFAPPYQAQQRMRSRIGRAWRPLVFGGQHRHEFIETPLYHERPAHEPIGLIGLHALWGHGRVCS